MNRNDDYIWLWSAIAEFKDALEEFSPEFTIEEIPGYIYQKVKEFFAKWNPPC